MTVSDHIWKEFWNMLTRTWNEWKINQHIQADWRSTLADCNDADLLWKAKTEHYCQRGRYKSPDLGAFRDTYLDLARRAHDVQFAEKCRIYWICLDSTVQGRIGMIRDVAYACRPEPGQVSKWIDAMTRKRGYQGTWTAMMGSGDHQADWVAAARIAHKAKHDTGVLAEEGCKICAIDDLVAECALPKSLADPGFINRLSEIVGGSPTEFIPRRIEHHLATPTADGLRRNTPATKRKTLDLLEGQVLELTATVLTEKKASTPPPKGIQ